MTRRAVVGPVFAWLVLGESLGLRQIIGMGVVLFGLFLSQITRKKPRTREMLYVEG